MAWATNWTHDDQLKAQGLSDRAIARQWEIPWSTFHREKQKRDRIGITVSDTLSMDLIERDAQEEGVERKDIVNLVFHEFSSGGRICRSRSEERGPPVRRKTHETAQVP
jgi:hypothetical protein